MLGYAEEHETTVLELTYNYGVTEYTKGNAYAQVVKVVLGLVEASVTFSTFENLFFYFFIFL